ncbi:MAG: CDP-glycerol glycerophosphotransferase family protein [bacterium]|nr:CDP-glycerol glycerophosphotransferase family protein [bacterium]
MKTIVITSFHPVISRSILSTDIIPFLTEGKDVRVVVCMPEYKRRFFEKYYTRPHVIFEGMQTGFSQRSRRLLFFKRFGEGLLGTKKVSLQRRRTFSGGRRSFLSYILFAVPGAFFGKWHVSHRIFRFFDNLISPKGSFDALFETYKPDLVFATDIQNEHDVAALRDAERKGIRVVGMVRSWDNLTSRALRVIPKTILVHNNIMKQEAVVIHAIDPSCVHVVGIPHYDRYKKGPTMSRKDFLRSLGADPAKKLIVYAPICDFRISESSGNDVDRHALSLLSTLNATIVVRFAPTTPTNLEGFAKPNHMIFDFSGHIFKESVTGDREISPHDDERLVHLFSYADCTVISPSSMLIDAAFFDKPIVMVNFFPRTPAKDEKIFEYEVEHIQPILASGGVRIATNKEDFLSYVQGYLDDPSKDADGRARIVQEQCAYTDGGASRRIADILLRSFSGSAD